MFRDLIKDTMNHMTHTTVADRIHGQEASIQFNPQTGRYEGTANEREPTLRPATAEERAHLAMTYGCVVPSDLIVKVY